MRWLIATGALLTLLAPAASGAATFTNPNGMGWSGSGPTTGPVELGGYPSPISVTGLTGAVTKVTATIAGINGNAPEWDLLLVSPTGRRVMLMSDAGQTSFMGGNTFTFDDAASSALPQSGMPSPGTYKPSDYADDACPSTASAEMPSPAPPAPFANQMSAFVDDDPTGDWGLYVQDDCAGNAGVHAFGAMAGGWSLTISTRAGSPVRFTSGSFPVGEPGTATLSLARGAPATGNGTLRYTLSDGTAKAGQDYDGTPKIVRFGPGQTTATVQIPILSDAATEPAETFTVSLSSFTGDTTLGDLPAANVEIAANTATPPVFPPVRAAVGSLALSPAAFFAAPSGASTARRSYGSRVRYSLNVAARVKFTAERKLAGRRVGRRCVAPTRANRGRPRCTRYRTVPGSFSANGKTGANSLRFTGRLGGRRLSAGSYRLTATPAGGTAKRALFRVKKP